MEKVRRKILRGVDLIICLVNSRLKKKKKKKRKRNHSEIHLVRIRFNSGFRYFSRINYVRISWRARQVDCEIRHLDCWNIFTSFNCWNTLAHSKTYFTIELETPASLLIWFHDGHKSQLKTQIEFNSFLKKPNIMGIRKTIISRDNAEWG
jgi:hypothetical protein